MIRDLLLQPHKRVLGVYVRYFPSNKLAGRGTSPIAVYRLHAMPLLIKQAHSVAFGQKEYGEKSPHFPNLPPDLSENEEHSMFAGTVSRSPSGLPTATYLAS